MLLLDIADDDESILGEDPTAPPLTKKQKKAALLAAEEKKKGGRKHKGPIDVDKQCGVINDKGLPCSRSLTCKSHSMGAKRAVEGRSAPIRYAAVRVAEGDQPKLCRKLEEKEKAIAAAKAAAAAAPPKEKKKKSAPGKDGKGKASGAGATAGGAGAGGSGGVFIEDDDMDMFDAGADEDQMDQELVSVLGAIANAAARDRTTPLPLATRSFAGCYASRAKRMRNLRELLREGLAPNGVRTGSMGMLLGQTITDRVGMGRRVEGRRRASLRERESSPLCISSCVSVSVSCQPLAFRPLCNCISLHHILHSVDTQCRLSKFINVFDTAATRKPTIQVQNQQKRHKPAITAKQKRKPRRLRCRL